MKNYRVNEIFYSLQGEGSFVGTPAVFIRLSGCNRACPFCDTDFESYTLLTADEIVEEASRYPARMAILTGGEPLLQADAELIDTLRREGFSIHVETNGTLEVPDGIDWVTCSPKDDEVAIQPNRVNEVKIVYTGQTAQQLTRIKNKFPHTRLFYLQPCSGANIEETVARVLSLTGWRLSLQVHKLIDIQ